MCNKISYVGRREKNGGKEIKGRQLVKIELGKERFGLVGVKGREKGLQTPLSDIASGVFLIQWQKQLICPCIYGKQ